MQSSRPLVTTSITFAALYVYVRFLGQQIINEVHIFMLRCIK